MISLKSLDFFKLMNDKNNDIRIHLTFKLSTHNKHGYCYSYCSWCEQAFRDHEGQLIYIFLTAMLQARNAFRMQKGYIHF